MITEISRQFAKDKEYIALTESLREKNTPRTVTGMCDSSRPFFAASLLKEWVGKGLLVVPEEKDAYAMQKILAVWFPRTLVYPSRDFVFENVSAYSREWEHERLNVLKSVCDGNYDVIVTVPDGLAVTNVTAGGRLVGGTISYNLASDGKLRIVYFDANANSDLTVSGETFPLELFNITFCIEDVNAGDVLDISISEMSLKLTSDSTDNDSKVEIETEEAEGSVTVVEGRTFSAGVLYEGDGIDLIPADKKAVVITVTQLEGAKKLTYNDGTNTVEFKYNAEISAKLGVTAYVALVDASIETENFEIAENYTIDEADADSITFGDINGDGVTNAQDALAAVDMWLRKGDEPTDDEILTANVNGDARIDTYDALAIVEAFVYDDREYAIVTKATTVFD